MKKVVIVLIFAIVALGIVGLGFMLSKKPTTNTNQTAPTGARLPSAETAGQNQNSQNPSSSLAATENNLTLPSIDSFYVASGSIPMVTTQGKLVSYANQKLTDVTNEIPNFFQSAFSYDGSKALFSFAGPTSASWNLYDLKMGKWIELTDIIVNPVWSPTTNRFAYLSPSQTGTKLYVSDGKTRTQALSLKSQGLEIQWSSPDDIYVFDRPSALAEGTVLDYNLKTKTVNPLFSGYGIDLLGGPQGSLVLFSTDRSHRGGQLSLMNRNGIITKQFSFLTLPSKCAFGSDSNTLYCAIPQDQGSMKNSVLPDDYWKKSLFTDDNIYAIDLASGDLKAVLTGVSGIDAVKLSVRSDKIYFINRYTNQLTSVKY